MQSGGVASCWVSKHRHTPEQPSLGYNMHNECTCRQQPFAGMRQLNPSPNINSPGLQWCPTHGALYCTVLHCVASNPHTSAHVTPLPRPVKR
jgi:hypothetical protein